MLTSTSPRMLGYRRSEVKNALAGDVTWKVCMNFAASGIVDTAYSVRANQDGNIRFCWTSSPGAVLGIAADSYHGRAAHPFQFSISVLQNRMYGDKDKQCRRRYPRAEAPAVRKPPGPALTGQQLQQPPQAAKQPTCMQL